MVFVCYAMNAIITKIMKAYLNKHALEVTHLTHAHTLNKHIQNQIHLQATTLLTPKSKIK